MLLPEMLFFNFRPSMQHFKSKSSFWPLKLSLIAKVNFLLALWQIISLTRNTTMWYKDTLVKDFHKDGLEGGSS